MEETKEEVKEEVDSREAEIQKSIASMRPIDDALFAVIADDCGFCEELLRTILSDPGIIVKEVIVQRSERNIFGRSVRLDALCELSDGTRCNVEVQRSNNDDHLRRARYNSSVITSRITDPGTAYKNVPDMIVVYISESDFLKGKRTIYHIEPTVMETGEKADLGVRGVFVNTAVDDGSKIAALMRCMIQTEVNDERFPIMSNRTARAKDNKGGDKLNDHLREIIHKNFSGEIEAAREEGREEGRKEGREEGRKEGRAEAEAKNDALAKNWLLKGRSVDYTAVELEMPVERVQAIAEKLKADKLLK